MTRIDDARWMWLALSVARRARPAPNPRVGAVVATGAHLVSVGWHVRAGGAHAEVVALEKAGAGARGATLYVTLEPCNHHGKTPPCVEAVLAAGVARVVFGCADPNPYVAGGGAARLRERGVAVELPALRTQVTEAQELIEGWAQRLVGEPRGGPPRDRGVREAARQGVELVGLARHIAPGSPRPSEIAHTVSGAGTRAPRVA